MNDGIIEKYERLPEWLRWIICWPISIIVAVLYWQIIYLVHGFEILDIVLRIAQPVVIQVLLLVMLYTTVPRAKVWIVLAVVILRALFLLFFLGMTILLVSGVVATDVEMTWGDWWLPLIGEILTVLAALLTFGVLKEQQDGENGRRA